MVLLQACSPGPRLLDTPMHGQEVALSVSQPMKVRWSNMSPEAGRWVLEGAPRTVKVVSQVHQPAAGGALALDIFDLVGAEPGSERVTFVYEHKDGRTPAPEERVSLELKVG
jgi:hypothetical protein